MKRIKDVDLAMAINNKTYINFYDRLKLLALSLFKWENLDKIAGFGASNFLENALFTYGKACFIKDDTKGFMVLNATPSDKLNIYYLPEKIMAWSIGYSKQYRLDNCVYIMNNKLAIPTYTTTELFAYRLYDTQRTIDINLLAQKTPVLIETDDKTQLTLKNAYMQFSGNMPVIYGHKDFLENKINSIRTDAPYLVNDINYHKHELLNEYLNFLGINSANIDKKERLIVNELESTDELIYYYLNCFYEMRKQAEEMINEKYLKDSDVKIKLIVNKKIINEIKNFWKEGVNDEQIHNNDQEFDG